mgnify:CR=1 FL=1
MEKQVNLISTNEINEKIVLGVLAVHNPTLENYFLRLKPDYFDGEVKQVMRFVLEYYEKYKSNCFLHDKNVKTRTIGMAFDIKDNYTPIEEQQINSQLNNLSKLL